MTAVLITLLAVVVALLVVLVAGLMRGQAHILRLLQDLSAPPPVAADPDAGEGVRPDHDPGSPRRAADIVGARIDGRPVEIAVAGCGHATLLMFLTGTCTTCAGLWSSLDDPRQRCRFQNTNIIVVAKGDEAESTERLERIAPGDVTVVMSTPAWAAYGAEVAPHFAYIGPQSDVVAAEGAATSWEDVVAACEPGAVRS
jgi:hypothetical protein